MILDNLQVHKSAKAVRRERPKDAGHLSLSAYSPDLNSIEHSFSKHKAPLRKIEVRSGEALSRAIGDLCALFEPQEYRNCFKVA
ncbi:transposase [Microvirga sp. VF16]|uniref:transposase n=1 Tax=Microvirga sp. VF16 TaxID=2807101 RepID=UPI00193E2EA0|nr:transposase [Microvirga sp. VF16]QRM34678.1 transposase [Microvirga sp. VF16]